jgi:hypothetical protein
VCGKRAFNGQVADNIAAYDDEVSGDEVLAVQITHHVTNGGRCGLEEAQMLEGGRKRSPFGFTGNIGQLCARYSCSARRT